MQQARAILAINGGSSSIKCALFTAGDDLRLIARHSIDETGAHAASDLMAWQDENANGLPLAAIGHRIVHGGPTHSGPEWITPEVIEDLRRLVPFAPNHLPQEIAWIEAIERQARSVPQLACFDTAFHQTMPAVARRLPIPAEYDARGVRRYGFHGLSYTYLAEALHRSAGERVARGRVVLAHLGNGSSLAALREGRSVDTTMGFTPIGGVVMSTRTGDLDPGVVTFLGRNEGLSSDQLEEMLSKRAGLSAISGGISDMKTLLARAAGDDACGLAVEMYAYSVAKAIGAFAAVLGGIDAAVFSGGIGEHAPEIRERICDRLGFLGVHLDAERNAANAALISPESEHVQVRVIATDEELIIARAACRLLTARES